IQMAADYAAAGAAKPIAFITPTSHSQTDYSRALRAKAPRVSFLQEANKGLRAIASVARRDALERIALDAHDDVARTPEQRAAIANLQARARAKAQALNEADSKEILRRYGIATPQEALVTSPEDAAAAATRIGYPVVLKAVSDTLTHKSDVGAVALNLANADDVANAYERMAQNLRAHGLAGMLVCQ